MSLGVGAGTLNAIMCYRCFLFGFGKHLPLPEWQREISLLFKTRAMAGGFFW